MARLLLENEAEVNCGLYTGPQLKKTPLSAACEKGHIDTVRLLLEASADLEQGLPLQAATQHSHITIVEILKAAEVQRQQKPRHRCRRRR